MSYKKATTLLPADLLKTIQEYVDGEYIYIPRIPQNKRQWGAKTSIREELKLRNTGIYQEYLAGANPNDLARKYFLSLKSIQRIIRQQKKNFIY